MDLLTQEKNYSSYLRMQKGFYEAPVPSADIVGFYDVHEEYPYETFLLYVNGDVRKPIFESLKDKRALDFACGPGRMVNRMKHVFGTCDGVDISAPLIAEAKHKNPGCDFWVTNGDDLGGAPLGSYDFVYSTIALQHIAVYSIRMQILDRIADALKPEGKITLQFAYNARFPNSKIIFEGKVNDGNNAVAYAFDPQHAQWGEDRINAGTTNSSCDVGIGLNDLPVLVDDFEQRFANVDYWFHDQVHFKKQPIHRDPHGYWPTHWIFVHATKK